ncbi:proline-rich receptor-like protein kinase PERK8 [Gossypium arboreum]|uniref:Uncharacterized protein n=1 Tax=Gossypium arboreum TaxID=29729 RepID=A0ABR0N0Q3_GOSAR|nr:proline-rich receptor-like protein kinase PERK8 [Gossypium arboreum]KAK5784121.1 hypothetical protein PVK06_038639 [Gossypium arboreum]
MDGGGSGGDGVSDSENEPIEGSTSTTATQNPSVVIGQEHQPEPSRFPLHNYSPPPPPSWPPPPSSPPPVRRTPSYPPPRPPPRTSLRSYTPPPPPRRPLTVTNFSFSRPTDPLRARIPPPPGFSFPTPRPRPLRQPSPALAARPFLTCTSQSQGMVGSSVALELNHSGSATPSHAKPDPGRRNRLKIITKRKRSEESKDGNNEERSGIVIRDKQPPSRDRCKEDQQGNPDDPDSDKDDSLPRMDIYQGIVD